MNYKEEDRGYKTPCKIWLGHTAENGYGKIGHDGVVSYVHRYYYEREKEKIPSNKEIDHLCRVRNCINTDHMKLATHVENTRRRINLKLSLEKAQEIRKRYANGNDSIRWLARVYNVSPGFINNILHNRKWKLED